MHTNIKKNYTPLVIWYILNCFSVKFRINTATMAQIINYSTNLLMNSIV